MYHVTLDSLPVTPIASAAGGDKQCGTASTVPGPSNVGVFTARHACDKPVPAPSPSSSTEADRQWPGCWLPDSVGLNDGFVQSVTEAEY